MKKLFKKILYLILPNRCLTCNCLISEDALFCDIHFKELKFINDPKCAICSNPFASNSKSNLLCVSCLTDMPFYNDSVTIFGYNNSLKKIIANLKYYDATFLSKKFAKLLVEKIAPNAKNYDLIIAVPLHRKRLRTRKYNQSILLCKTIKRDFPHLKFYPDFLIRTKFSKTQTALNKKEREKNLENIFKINQKYIDLIKGKNILLIDDVITTGATLNNCAKVLKNVGCGKITIVTIAKTVLQC